MPTNQTKIPFTEWFSGLPTQWQKVVEAVDPNVTKIVENEALYTMDQMREYADNFHRARLEYLAPKIAEKVLDHCYGRPDVSDDMIQRTTEVVLSVWKEK